MSPEEAVELIKDGDVVKFGGFIGTGLQKLYHQLQKKNIKSGFQEI